MLIYDFVHVGCFLYIISSIFFFLQNFFLILYSPRSYFIDYCSLATLNLAMTSGETSSAKKRRKRNRWVVVIQVMVMFDAFNHGDVALTDVKRRRQMTYSPLSMSSSSGGRLHPFSSWFQLETGWHYYLVWDIVFMRMLYSPGNK